MDRAEATARLLDTADILFYSRGIQAVGMAEVRTVSGVSLKRLYQCFPSKEHLVGEYLRRRDQRWLRSLADYVEQHDIAHRPLAVFDWLADWFTEPGFRGCAFVNSFGESGARSQVVACAAKEHKEAVRQYLIDLLSAAPATDRARLADQLLLLIDGATASAAITGSPDAARNGRDAAAVLLAASGLG